MQIIALTGLPDVRVRWESLLLLKSLDDNQVHKQYILINYIITGKMPMNY